ncbi:sulfotransferase domain-containing protein [Nisaea nitritireducens]|uniref:sulfotransferase domain-containing protein n=1 Tax=Nisaea nitritireducens TaxID=568392 RepID=UPI0018663951|nr:sulfotransferase domain-containing protein [Nisaea nitritireducens]
MSGILWLASFPKSGNTWLRVFIENLFRNSAEPVSINELGVVRYGDMMGPLYEKIAGKPLQEMSDAELHALREPLQKQWAQEAQTTIVKTHNALAMHEGRPLIYLECTAGAAYVVRNVFDVTVSYADHYRLTLDDAVEAMTSGLQTTRTSPAAVFQVLGTWTDHYRSWHAVENFNPLTLRYEDMVKSPMKAFGSFMRYLGVPKNPERLKRAIKNSSFRVVSGQEKQSGFRERVHQSQKFFRSGGVGGYRDLLSDDHVKRLTERHYDLLLELGYVFKSGKPRV